MKSMKLTLLIFLLLNISKKPLAQNDSAFYNNFLNAYKIQAKPPLNNYYIVLTNTAASVFSLKNSNFISMLSSFSKTYNISEKEALEKIFYDTFNKFSKESVWFSSENIYTENKNLFEPFYISVCPCISGKENTINKMQNIASSLQQCTAALMKDSNYLKIVKSSLGSKPLSAFYGLGQYFTIYMYQNCDIIKNSFNESILHSTVLDLYISDLSKIKTTSAELAINYFIDNRFDSLSIIFPNYKKYINEFIKIKKVVQIKTVVKNSRYQGYFQDNDRVVKITLQKKDILAGTIIVTNFSASHDSKIEKISFLNAPKFKKEEIVEITEDAFIIVPPSPSK
jgi:hypothetical protein